MKGLWHMFLHWLRPSPLIPIFIPTEDRYAPPLPPRPSQAPKVLQQHLAQREVDAVRDRLEAVQSQTRLLSHAVDDERD